MLPRRLLRTALLLCGPVLTFVASCRDTTAPPRVHPMSGVYDFTTILDSLSYEEGGPLSCGSNVMYCVKWRADSAGRLSGTFEVGDVVDYNPSLVQTVYGEVGGEAAGRFAGQAVSVTVASGYVGGPLTMSDTTDSVEAQLTGPAHESIHFWGTFAGDSIVGRVYWSQTIARHPPTYQGTFVARRRW